MASNVAAGAYAVWYYKGTLTNAQKVAVRTGKIPVVSSSNWSRLFTSLTDSASIEREGETLDLGTQEEGILKTIVSAVDTWTVNIPIADVSVVNAKRFMMLNPAFATSSGTGVRIDGSYIGTDLSSYGDMIVIANKNYAGTSYNKPTLTDPNAFVFVNAYAADRAGSFNYDPGAQQIYNVALRCTALTSSSGAHCFGYHGLISTTS